MRYWNATFDVDLAACKRARVKPAEPHHRKDPFPNEHAATVYLCRMASDFIRLTGKGLYFYAYVHDGVFMVDVFDESGEHQLATGEITAPVSDATRKVRIKRPAK